MTQQRTTADIPEFFPAVQMDSRINCLRRVCDLQIHLVLRFQQPLNIERLRRAIRLSLDAEPILGCQLREQQGRLIWQRRNDLDELELLSVVKGQCSVTAVTDYMATPLDLDNDPLVQGRLFRDQTDTLCLKVSHIVADGGALGEYGELLAGIYRQLEVQPDYVPEPNIDGERSIHQITRQFDLRARIGHFKELFRCYLGELFPRKNWSYYDDDCCESEYLPKYVIHRLDECLSDKVVSFAKINNLTVNDVFVAACYRALFYQISPSVNTPLRLGTTVNLRRYLPGYKGAALCNLSAMFQLNIGCKLGSDLRDTANLVHKEMVKYKKNDIGMGDKRYYLFDLDWMPARYQKLLYGLHSRFKYLVGPKSVAPLFSNAGILDSFNFDFNNYQVIDAYVTPPAVHSPVFFVALSGLGKSLTLAAGINSRSVAEVNALFKRFEEELLVALVNQ